MVRSSLYLFGISLAASCGCCLLLFWCVCLRRTCLHPLYNSLLQQWAPFLLQTEQTQLPHNAFHLLCQPFWYFNGLPLDLLQFASMSCAAWHKTVLHMWPHQCQAEGNNYFPRPAVCALTYAAQTTVSSHRFKGTLLADVQLAVW